jgi:hypothetical protein
VRRSPSTLAGANHVTAKREITKKGDYIWCEVKGALVYENGKMKFPYPTRDISEAKEAAALAIEKLKKQEHELRTNLVSTHFARIQDPMTTIRFSVELITLYLDQELFNAGLIERMILSPKRSIEL